MSDNHSTDDERRPAENRTGNEGTERTGRSERADRTNRTGNWRHSRRRFLQTAAVTGAAAGISAVGAAEDQDESADDGEDTDEAHDWSQIELGGFSDAWLGQSPEEIEDVENPTLYLEEGESYEVTWENLDDVEHNFVIINEEGEHLLETDLMGEAGETQTVEFEAESEMAEYYCGPHPQTMRGDISFEEADDPEPDEEMERYFPEGPTVGVDPVATGLGTPTDFEDPPGTDYQLVAEQTGQIYAIGDDGIEDEPWLDITDRLAAVAEDFYGDDYADPDQDYDERGLVGLECHPDYEENGRFVLNYSAPPVDVMPESWSHVQVISEFEVDDDGEPDPDSERRLMEFYMPQYNHNSGPMAFGPDGYLLVPMGDGGGADDRLEGHVEDWYDENEGGNGQDTTQSLLGGVLRIDIDGEPTEHPARGSLIHLDLDEGDVDEPDDDAGYAIPDNNPFSDGEELAGEGLEEYYAWGLRNPFGITVSEDDQIIVADPGQVLYEPAYQIEKAGNYGWNVREGSHCFSTETPATPPEECPLETPEDVRGGEPLIDPVVEYPQVYEGTPVGIVIVGGHTYEADAIDELDGAYIFGDWTADQGRVQPRGRVFAAHPEDVPEVSEERDEFGSRPREDLWEMEEVLFGENGGTLNHFVRQFGRGEDGEVYVLANREGVPEGDTGVVLELVPEDEGVPLDEVTDAGEADEEPEEEEPENDVADEDEEQPENDVADEDAEDGADEDSETGT
ncbi:blue copper domain protein [Natrialba hulunbeirensis JCM 10989]|uniref:Blue copper domain protein n=1 Tax=Natrialba hulunbeirensis JCM 10989 TaxID=1227493 RepID=L9ZQC4_9EURY|nr:PQQ-dependent sugar dehydrogenase [Natrialba hulunbeirensis]ELY88705.1 blue copper domain protein [Natrialba hulunbeirensis JCM 10989]